MESSHVGTTEWQSFEARMRRRRAERCLLRADAAIDARCFDEARHVLDEARLLWPSAQGLDDLQHRLAKAKAQPTVDSARGGAVLLEMPPPIVREPTPSTVESTPPVAADSQSKHPHTTAAVAMSTLLLIVLGSAFWYGATRDVLRLGSRATRPSEPRASEPFAPSDPVQPGPSQREASVTVSSTTEIVAHPVRERAADDAIEAAPAPTVPAVPAATAPAATTGQIQRATDPAPAAPHLDLGTSAPVSANLPPPERPSAMVSPAASRVDPVGALAAAATEPPPALVSLPAPAPAAAGNPPPVSDVERVRTVLNRYESAYTSLDARAAGAVYPRLDTRALARAFDGLSAQRVSLGRCDVVVSTMSAQASCAGSASWTPKVGGAAQTSARQWRFELRRNGETWQIAEAVIR
jgi:hypothetical protein